MSTAVAPGMPLAHGFRGSEKGKADSEEAERNTNGFFIEDGEKEVGAGEALSESSSIGAASSDSSSIGEDSSSEKGGGAAGEEEGEEVESKVKGVEEGLGDGGIGDARVLGGCPTHQEGPLQFLRRQVRVLHEPCRGSGHGGHQGDRQAGEPLQQAPSRPRRVVAAKGLLQLVAADKMVGDESYA